ncbi:MAG: hypothetical protein DLM53_00280 [Candidatus Eremiobacter antarcticus]|nr:MAG: hypothetical protein DLM53_00280 [Candidatus Eremiobacter sp. RRmetagenome_bin22]
MLKERLGLLAEVQPPAALAEAAVHLWIISLSVTIFKAPYALISLCDLGQTLAASILRRTVVECAYRISFLIDNPAKALRLQLTDATWRVRAKKHLGDITNAQETLLETELRASRTLYRQLRQDLASGTDDEIDEAMEHEHFPDMVTLLKKYGGGGRQYVTDFVWPSHLGHGGILSIRDSIESFGDRGEVIPNLGLSDGFEQRYAVQVAGYCLWVAQLLSEKYSLGESSGLQNLIGRQADFLKGSGSPVPSDN